MIWLGVVFLLVVGFGYSYFWTASTIIYSLMRKVVDDTEIDEIHLEEDLQQPFAQEMNAQPPPGPGPGAAPGGPGLTMVEPPTLRTTPPPPPEPPKPAEPPPG